MTTSIAIHWRLFPQRYQLAGRMCSECGHKMFPPRPTCPACADRQHVLSFNLGEDQPLLVQVPTLLLQKEAVR